MNGALHTASRSDLAAALGWLVEAGCDTIVGDTPFDWLGAVPVRSPVLAAPEIKAPTQAISTDSLGALATALAESGACPAGVLALLADGNPESGVMLIGDRPTAADALAGRVFADPAGALLDRMLASIGRSRETAYLANLVAWPTPGDRAATADEIAASAPFLRRQIELARPRAILALGQAAASALCGSTAGIARLRGHWHRFDPGGLAIPVMPSFHPAHLLLHPGHKALAWADLCAFREKLEA